MFRSILSFSLSLIAGAVFLASSAAAEPQYSRAGAIPLSHDDDYGGYDRWNERTCCQREERRGYRVFWSTQGECRRSGGQSTTNKMCRKHGGFHPYDRNYRGDHDGYGYDGGFGWQDGNYNERVCCARNGQVWWSTKGECRRASGYQATNKTCRRN
jgi:hypothetical protein